MDEVPTYSYMEEKMTDKNVKFCKMCVQGIKCKSCDKTFDRKKPLQTTSFHQIKNDLTTFVAENFTEMITDIGCPNSVIGVADVDRFKRNLSKFQKENIEVRQVDENFMFGPSGPFNCSEKLRFPIKHRKKVLWVEVAIVKAKIPMLLGNNILKPLGAEIKLFSEGNGVLNLEGTEIEMRETNGGHYTIKVSDLGKLSDGSADIDIVSENFQCEVCKNVLKNRKSLNLHIQSKHENHGKSDLAEMRKMKSALKGQSKSSNDYENIIKDIEGENCIDKVVTDLNTLMNSSTSKTEKKLIMITKKLAQIQQKCDKCEKTFQEKKNIEDQTTKKETELVFLSHHEEDSSDCEIEIDPMLWEVFLSEDDGKELSEEEKKEILKLHKYFAHRNGRKLWDNLFQPAGRLKGKKKLVLKFLDQCDVCRKYRRTPSRPKVGLPKANDVNDVVSIDLKILKKTGNKEVAILYLHDEFSKLTKGQVVNDKKPDTIIKAIENKWIIGGGIGPGHPSRGFFSDNGGEFLNEDLIDFAAALDITIRMTAASSPWMNGSCERAHATVDKTVEKILEDDPKTGIQKAVDLACFVKNTEINKTGFSPLQLFCGRSPSFPGFSDCTPGSIELEGSNEYLKVLRRMDNARVTARQIDCNQRIKVALKSKINTSCEKTYGFGDSIWFKLDSSNKWKSGMVLGQHGKVLFIKYGNFIRRVPLDFVIPADERKNVENEEDDQEDIDNHDRLQDDDFDNEELMAKKEKEIENLKRLNLEQEKLIKELENNVTTASRMENEANSSKRMENHSESAGRMENHSDSARRMEDTKYDPILPKQFQKIKFKVVGNKNSLQGKVVKKHKRKSTHRNIVVVKLAEGIEKEFDFSENVVEWSDDSESLDEIEEPCCLHSFSENKDIFHSNYLTVLTKSQLKGRPDVKPAIEQEIKKFEDFGAFKRVADKGQYAIKTRWVFSESEDESKGCKLKARLCMRGDTEENIETIRADSPTAHKDSLKLGLAIAANENFEIIAGDIKSAFLQGMSLQRKVYVIPPSEANESDNLWLLQKGAYGLLDGSRLFYLELRKKLESLGMKVLSGDSALFTKHENGKLIGLVCIHVDDLLMAGNNRFRSVITKKLFRHFKFSKMEESKFKYLGCQIEKLPSGDITLNQNDYIQNIKEVLLPPKRNSCRVTDFERKEIRRVVGELLWVSLMTRPDISFEVNKLSSEISNATIRQLKDAKWLVDKAKVDPISLNFTRLGNKEDLKIKLFCDASFNNQENKIRSTEGRVLLLEGKDSRKANIFSWKTKKISRICRSVKGAETRSLENGLDEAIHFARMVREIYDGVVNLKDPKQIEVEAVTDNKGLWENLHNTRQCDEKLLRNSVALMKEMIEKNEVKKVDWVETNDMLADVLTKKGGNGSWIKEVVSRNLVSKNFDKRKS